MIRTLKMTYARRGYLLRWADAMLSRTSHRLTTKRARIRDIPYVPSMQRSDVEGYERSEMTTCLSTSLNMARLCLIGCCNAESHFRKQNDTRNFSVCGIDRKKDTIERDDAHSPTRGYLARRGKTG